MQIDTQYSTHSTHQGNHSSKLISCTFIESYEAIVVSWIFFAIVSIYIVFF
jgi:hypothetical protein